MTSRPKASATGSRPAHSHGRLPPLILLLGLLAACGGDPAGPPAAEEHREEHSGEAHGSEAEGHGEGVIQLSADQLAAIEVDTARIERQRLSARLQTTGEVGYEEDRIAHVAPRIAGRVQRVAVSLGDEVRRGQLLAVLDSVELGQAQAAFLAARTRENLARRNYEREEELYADRITSEREMLQAQAAYEEAASMRQSAQETLRLYGIPSQTIGELKPGDPGASLLPVHAPITGRVVEKHATLGELATPGDTLFTLGDLSHVWVWIDVFERDLAQVHEDDDVEVEVDAYPGRVFSGEVTYLSPTVEAETRTVRARIDVDNGERLLRPGMYATVRITDPHAQGTESLLVAPETAVVRRGEHSLVFVPVPGPASEGRRFLARPVQTGRREAGWVEILDGVEAGDPVVTEGVFFLESELAREELGGGHGH